MDLTPWYDQVLDDHPHLAHPSTAQVDEVRKSRDIHPDVWRGRAFEPYDAGDWAAVTTAEPRFKTLKPGRQGFLRRMVNQRPGLVMQRATWPGERPPYRRLLAQLRPFKMKEFGLSDAYLAKAYADFDPEVGDEGLFNHDYYHDHAAYQRHVHDYNTDSVVATSYDSHTRSGKLVPAKRADSGEWLPAQTGSLRFGNEDPIVYRLSPSRDHVDFLTPGQDLKNKKKPRTVVEESDEPRPGTLAWHAKECHYGERPRGWHDHQAYMRDHLAMTHGGRNEFGRHNHPVFLKYCYAPKENTKLIDVHPDAWALFEAGAEVGYVALEGVLKSDSIQSEGMNRDGSGGTPVANAGSVTLWRDPAWAWFAAEKLQHLDLVAVVPDSDALGIDGDNAGGNDKVIEEAEDLRDQLRSYGLRAVVAIPPATCGEICTHPTRYIGQGVYLPDRHHKQGVDDHRGSGGKLKDMIVMPERPRGDVEAEEYEGRGIAKVRRNSAALKYLQDRATPTGRVFLEDGLRGMGEAIGYGKDAANEALDSLAEEGYLKRQPNVWESYSEKRRTVVRLTKRQPQQDPMTLGEYLHRAE
jgi:hypothetical protein